MKSFREVIKEQFGMDSSRTSNTDPELFNRMVNKPSNLGCLEFKYHDGQQDIDHKVEEVTPLLNELGVRFISVIKMSNILVITATKENAAEVKNICMKFGFSLLKETFSDAPKPYNALTNWNKAPDANGNLTDYGRGSSDGRTSFTGGSMMTGYPVDRLAGE